MTRMLATIARLRRLQADQAERALADAISGEVSAEAAALQARRQREAEGRAALREATAGGPLAGAYAAWLPQSAAHIAAADEAVAARQADRASAVSDLMARRADIEAVALVLAEREDLRRRRAARRAQLQLDEVGLRRAPSAAA